MGLDMYLKVNSKRVSQEVNGQTDEWECAFQTPRGIAIYWRKANAIHKWFVDNVQGGTDDCGSYEVSVDDLVRLHDACKEVLESTRLVDAEIQNGAKLDENGNLVPIIEKGQKLEDPTKAMELLPTQDGFFSGSTAYDQWYWLDVEFTQRKLEKLLDMLEPVGDNWNVVHEDEPDWYVEFRYESSW